MRGLLQQNDGSTNTTHLYAWVSRDRNGVEGIIMIPTLSGVLPLVMADRVRAERFVAIAQKAADERHADAELRVYVAGETLRTLHPGET